MNKEKIRNIMTGYELMCQVIKENIKEGTYINCYTEGWEEYPIKYLYTNGSLWKTEDNIPDNEMEVKISIIFDKNNLFEILDKENDEFEDIELLGSISLDDYKDADLYGMRKWKIEERTTIDKLIRNQKKIIERLNKDE